MFQMEDCSTYSGRCYRSLRQRKSVVWSHVEKEKHMLRNRWKRRNSVIVADRDRGSQKSSTFKDGSLI